VTANLATAGTGTRNPARFFSRRGPGPAAAVSAAHAVTHALTRLEPESGIPLAAYLMPLGRVQDSVRLLAAGLALEARIAAEALTADLSLPEPEAAREVRERLKAAARGTLSAADHVRAAHRALNRELRRHENDPGSGGHLTRRANTAADCVAELKTELTQAARRPVPASLPMVAGRTMHPLPWRRNRPIRGAPMSTTSLSEELAAVRGELARVDGKCATLAGLTGAAAAFTATQAGRSALVAVQALTVSAGLAFTAAALVLLTVLRPTLGSGGFCQWATLSAAEIESRAAQRGEDARPGGRATIGAARTARAEAAELLWILSVIAVTKYRRLRLAVDLAVAGVALLAVTAVATGVLT
jgi:hypothetical protein